LGGSARCWGGFSAIDDYAGGAFVQCGLSLFGGLVFFVVNPGEIVVYRKDIALFCAQFTADTADPAHRAGCFWVFSAATRDGHDVFRAERYHLD